jgi:hypothetical protein
MSSQLIQKEKISEGGLLHTPPSTTSIPGNIDFATSAVMDSFHPEILAEVRKRGY